MDFPSAYLALKKVLWAFLLCSLGCSPWASAATQEPSNSVRFVDQNNQPLQNVVVLGTPKALKIQQPERYVMDQVNKSFVPHVLIVPAGSLVEFPNSDDIRHHVYSFSKAKPFELKLYAGKPEAPIQFDAPGIVVLGCNIHDTMVGYIIVSDTDQWALSNDQGIAKLDRFNGSAQTVRIWHPKLDEPQRFLTKKLPLASQKNHNEEATIKLNIKLEKPQDSKFRNNRFKRYGG